MGFWSTLGKIAAPIGAVAAAPFTAGTSLAWLPAALGAGGAALGAAGQASAQNRGEKFGGQIDLERLLMERESQSQGLRINREQEGRASASDAFRKLLGASRLLSPGTRPQLSPYSQKPRAITAEEQRGASSLIEEVLKRLEGGNPIPQVTDRPMSVDPNLLNAGGFEKFAGIASPILAGLSQYKKPQPQLQV